MIQQIILDLIVQHGIDTHFIGIPLGSLVKIQLKYKVNQLGDGYHLVILIGQEILLEVQHDDSNPKRL